jgi:nitroimidazol reductase NimA-like FMN-containing flavoprotein (pyridoxamine 5'-phosphate oxidase superfamily)
LNLGLDDLEEFDPENLTPEQAKKLVEKLKEAKTRGDKYKSRFVKGKLKVNDTLERKDKEWESKVDEVVSKKLEETTFFTSNPEAAEHKEDIYKIAKEKNLSLHEAYKVVMFDKISDPAYQARLRA